MTTSYTVPLSVRRQARRGILLRRKHGRGGLDAKQAKKEGVGSGVQRASNLMQGKVSYTTVKRMLAFFSRHSAFKEHHKDRTSASYISWLLWGGDEGFAWAKRIVREHEREKSQKAVPAKYLEGLSGKDREKRKKEIERRKGKKKVSYAPLHGDKKVKTKPSKYTRTRLASAVRKEIKKTGKNEFLRACAKLTKVNKKILEEVYDRGLKAWATSGHRVGATAQAWAKARVYSFLTGGKTRSTADRDLWRKHKERK